MLWLAAGLALAILSVSLLRRSATAVVYQGKTIHAWSQQLYGALSPSQAEEAAAAFKTLGPTATQELIAQLKTQDPRLRKAVWWVAPRLPRRLRQAFLRNLKPLDSESLRASAARALGVIGQPAAGAVPALTIALRDPSRQVSTEAATALAHVGPASVPALIQALQDRDHEVRHMAAYSLGELSAGADPAIPALIGCLNDKNEYVRSSASYALSKLGPAAFSAVLQQVEHGKGLGRQTAARALPSLNGPVKQVQAALLTMMQDQEPASRQQAIESLAATYVSSEVMNHLIQALADPVAEVRVAAIKAIGAGKRKAQPAVAQLIPCLNEPSLAIRPWTARTLGEIGPDAQPAVSRLSELAQNDPNEMVRKAAADAIAKIEQIGSEAALRQDP